MSSKILELVITTDDVQQLEEELGLLQAATFQKKTHSLSEALRTHVRAEVAKVIQEELAVADGEQDKTQDGGGNKEDSAQYFSTVLEELRKIEVINVTLAFSPTLAFLEKMHGSLQTSAGAPVAIEVAYQPEIIGGAILTFRGKYYDYSLKKKLEQVAPEILKSYAKF